MKKTIDEYIAKNRCRISAIEEVEHFIKKQKDELYKNTGESIELYLSDRVIENKYNWIKENNYLAAIKESGLHEKVGEYKLSDELSLIFDLDLRGHIFYFKLNEEIEGMLYDEYINSWSGINEWLQEYIANKYDLYSGNSVYNHAFGTVTFKEVMDRIDNPKKQDIERNFEDNIYVIEQILELTDKRTRISAFDKILDDLKRDIDWMRKEVGK